MHPPPPELVSFIESLPEPHILCDGSYRHCWPFQQLTPAQALEMARRRRVAASRRKSEFWAGPPAPF